MAENYYKETDNGQYDEIDIMEILRNLVKNWKTLLKWGVIAAVIGLVIGFSLPNEYSVTVKMSPELSQKSGSGSIASLASLAGVNLSNMSATDAMFPDLYPEIVNSTPFIVDLLSLPVDFTYKKESAQTDLYDYMVNYTKSPWWSKVINLPFKALGAAVKLVKGEKGEDESAVNAAELDPVHLTRKQASLVKALGKSITVSVDKKKYIIQVDVIAQDPQVAYKLAQAVADNLQKHVSTYRTEKARHDLQYYQELYDEARASYFSAQQKYAQYVDANQGVVFQRVRTEQERLQNEASLAFQLYNQTAQQLQMAKAKVQQETPVVAVIQPAVVPTRKIKPSKAKILLACMFLGVCCAALWVLKLKDLLKKKDESQEEVKEGE